MQNLFLAHGWYKSGQPARPGPQKEFAGPGPELNQARPAGLTKDTQPLGPGPSQSPQWPWKEHGPLPMTPGTTGILEKGKIVQTHASAGVSGITSMIYAPESTSGKSRWRSFSSLALLLGRKSTCVNIECQRAFLCGDPVPTWLLLLSLILM